MKLNPAIGMCFLVFWSFSALGQNVQVNNANRTISISVSETIQAAPDIARIHLGFRTYNKTHDAAFLENARVMSLIVKAVEDAGVPANRIETERVTIQEAEESNNPTRGGKLFEAAQILSFYVATGQAQSVIDSAVAAGANELENVTWLVSDETVLESKANVAAIAKAKRLAGEMASQLGLSLGEMLYVSNSQPFRFPVGMNMTISAETAVVQTRRRQSDFKIFPAKVERQATIQAVFAIAN